MHVVPQLFPQHLPGILSEGGRSQDNARSRGGGGEETEEHHQDQHRQHPQLFQLVIQFCKRKQTV